MKSSIRKTTYEAIYRLTGMVSPIDGDCGVLCGSVCCSYGDGCASGTPNGSEYGMYLLPGEEKMHSRSDNWLKWNAEWAQDYDFPKSWRGKAYFVRCEGPQRCTRRLRPIQCRTFPLAPHIGNDGTLSLILHSDELPYSCPLIAQKTPLNERFVRATYTAWKRLLMDPLIFDLVEMDSKRRGLGITVIR
ncbi:MAG: hypothetical protein FWG42_01485 [Clostridiales bacterium]|nr:hypothetical protein [Clostridiales bacterium]